MSFADHILTLAAILEAVVLAPILLEFLAERRKRKHAVDLSLEVEDVDSFEAPLAGLDDLLKSISDLIDRARHPEAYKELQLGNEILIAGGPLSGKKALARRIAKDAAFDRVIIVHNPRNVDALARAKEMVHRAQHKKIMLLLPRLDLINERDDEESLVELDALIEATSELSHTLVIGTTSRLIEGSEVDNLFGITLTLPNAPIVAAPTTPMSHETIHMLDGVARFYLARAIKAGYGLAELTEESFVARLMQDVTNPAQIEDIVVLCQTAAIYRQRTEQARERNITPAILEAIIRRVIVSPEK